MKNISLKVKQLKMHTTFIFVIFTDCQHPLHLKKECSSEGQSSIPLKEVFQEILLFQFKLTLYFSKGGLVITAARILIRVLIVLKK